MAELQQIRLLTLWEFGAHPAELHGRFVNDELADLTQP
jgi:hypothetical protein